jgi:hypothetical protein
MDGRTKVSGQFRGQDLYVDKGKSICIVCFLSADLFTLDTLFFLLSPLKDHLLGHS